MDGKRATTVAMTGGSGVLLVYSAISGKNILSLLRAVLHGQNPKDVQPSQQIVQPTATASAAGAAGVIGTSDSELANIMLSYEGKVPYVWGGANPHGWDCSGAVNYCYGHVMGQTLPMGITGFTGDTHGPTTLNYLAWSGANTIPRSAVSAGDLCVWQTHIGVAINNTHMISALDPQLGTAVTTIEGGAPTGEILVCRRIKGSAGTNSPQPGKTQLSNF